MRNYPLYIKLQGTKTTGAVLLDQVVTIDYNARNFEFIESVPANVITELLTKVILVFQPNQQQT